MSEYEYEVTFTGSQWIVTVLVYHEQDTEEGKNEEASDAIQAWAEAVASNNGLSINDYHEVSIVKTGELL